MRILFDQGTPVPFCTVLRGHTVSTAYEMGLSTLRNGELLAAAEQQFDVLITTDKKLRYEQNLAERRLSILVLPFASWPRLQEFLPSIRKALAALWTGDYVELSLPE